jgi:hypothetical protein
MNPFVKCKQNVLKRNLNKVGDFNRKFSLVLFVGKLTTKFYVLLIKKLQIYKVIMEDGEEQKPNPALKKLFVAYGSADPNSGNQQILLSQSDRWMKNAKIFKNMKKITTTDTGIMFFKFR